jgi:hypothetical protein
VRHDAPWGFKSPNLRECGLHLQRVCAILAIRFCSDQADDSKVSVQLNCDCRKLFLPLRFRCFLVGAICAVFGLQRAASLSSVLPPCCCSKTVAASLPSRRSTSPGRVGVHRPGISRGYRGWQGHNTLSPELGCVCHGCLQRLMLQGWLAAHNLTWRRAACRLSSMTDSMIRVPLDARPSMTDGWIDGDVILPRDAPPWSGTLLRGTTACVATRAGAGVPSRHIAFLGLLGYNPAGGGCGARNNYGTQWKSAVSNECPW